MCDCLERAGNRDYFLNKLCSRKSDNRAFSQTWGSLKEVGITANNNAQESEDCFNVAASPPQIINRFDGLVICGKRGGYTFENMVRPKDIFNGKYNCPRRHTPCNDNFFDVSSSGKDYVVCIPEGVEKETVCPITSIAFDFDNSANSSNNP